MSSETKRDSRAGAGRIGEWTVLGEWLSSPPHVRSVDLAELRACLGFVGRARSSLAALESDLVSEIARREGDAAAEEVLRRDQKRSRASARKAVKTAAQLDWAPGVAEKLAEGAITPEAAVLILDAAGEAHVAERQLLQAAEEEPEDQFRRTLKEHINERTSEEELERRRAAQRRRRRASISEQSDGMFHLFAQFDPLTGAQVRAAKILPGIFNRHTGNVLLGRSQRKVPKRLRKRLVARDRGCIGCAAHEKICEVHHLHNWQHGGETTLENTCLLCWRCHHIRVHLNGEEITRHPGGRLILAPPTKPSSQGPQRPPPHNRSGTPPGRAERPSRPPPPSDRATPQTQQPLPIRPAAQSASAP